jgi:Flp pilus assembly protein TadD
MTFTLTWIFAAYWMVRSRKQWPQSPFPKEQMLPLGGQRIPTPRIQPTFIKWPNMFGKQLRSLAIIAVLAVPAGLAPRCAWAGDLKLTLPKRSELTLVQRLNRDGVEALRKHEYEKAEGIFFKAYLYDPGDPFTLNNLGYISELQGQLVRAQKFYKLASEQASDAIIDRSNAKALEGKPMRDAFGGLKDVPMQVNRMNVEAMQLLAESRAPEADLLLQQALAMDPQNTFTLNNLGVAKESRGDYDQALTYYSAAADSHSLEPVVVTLNHVWRGKPVSQMAADSAKKLRARMQDATTDQARAALLAVRGVSATNRNDWATARQDFLQSYSLDPGDAFSLNNFGYLAERDGDFETAQFFYAKAQKSGDANDRIGVATRRSAEGKHLFAVASDSDQNVGEKIVAEDQTRRTRMGPIELKHRDNSPVVESPGPVKEPQSSIAPSSVSNPTVPQPPQ